ncbi:MULTISPECIES: AtpZ/AtpI family protein [Bacillales]|uniref:AtpZ/AtpI family protein n=1 Tax=Paenibacillus agri TaxID=2744309 RepID=A0A850EF08_9BACL|nr:MULTISPECIES: AtpZ/AtpI family protein [Bacillales]NUU59745.1 AtpZ/AtpI family protein [Paenibacillus agri]OBZ07941.1 ATPase F0F1 [Bacillus sp. FJAT-27264]
MKQEKDRESLGRTALVIGSAGTLLAAYIIIGFFLAKWLRDLMDGHNYWLAIGTITGMILGIVNVVLLIKKFLGEQNG